MLDYALQQLEDLHTRWPETVQCNIVIERAPCASTEQSRYRATLCIELNRRGDAVRAKATGDDPYAAIRFAFADVQNCMPIAPQVLVAVSAEGEVAA